MKALRILVVECSKRDLDLIVREFRVSGYSVEAKRVETAEEMSEALRHAPWDVIISDNSLPAFDATRALAVLQASRLDIPFVIASGMIGEERAVELMKAGASDYVSKRNLPRLIPVVERELRDAAARLERHRVEIELAGLNAERERMLNQRSVLLDITNAVIARLDRQSLCQAVFTALRSGLLPCSAVALLLRNGGSLETVVAEWKTGAIMASGETALRELGRRVLATRQVLALELPSADHALPAEESLM